MNQSDITYASYLKIRELTDLQHPLSKPPCHDEMQFIIVHQAFELWFKLMLHEVDTIFDLYRAKDIRETERLYRRLTSILNVFIEQLKVIETMVPSDFVKFRDLLKPASGFQSWQFREIEFASGARDERYLHLFDDQLDLQARLKTRLAAPSLWDGFASMLQSLGFKSTAEPAIVEIYREERHHDLRMLCEAMIDYDETFGLWREHHVRMAERMIGGKAGTGQKVAEYSLGKGPMGTHGVAYLRGTLGKKFFPVLWDARTIM